MSNPIIVAVGANLESPEIGAPRETCAAALARLSNRGQVEIVSVSKWYESAPVPVSDQPWFVNACALIKTTLAPMELMTELLAVEATFGRVRDAKNAPRTLDLDIAAFGGQIMETKDLALPHPRLHERAFVLMPIRDLVPDWRHPITNVSVGDLIAQLPKDQQIRPMPDGGGYLGSGWVRETT